MGGVGEGVKFTVTTTCAGLPNKFIHVGNSLRISLASEDRREEFMLDITRAKRELTKVTFQNRARQIIRLLRLDIGGSPHRNPDDKNVPCPHLHIYREGYHDKWAYPLPTEVFSNPSNQLQTLQDFMKYCNIVKPLKINKALFT